MTIYRISNGVHFKDLFNGAVITVSSEMANKVPCKTTSGDGHRTGRTRHVHCILSLPSLPIPNLEVEPQGSLCPPSPEEWPQHCPGEAVLFLPVRYEPHGRPFMGPLFILALCLGRTFPISAHLHP